MEFPVTQIISAEGFTDAVNQPDTMSIILVSRDTCGGCVAFKPTWRQGLWNNKDHAILRFYEVTSTDEFVGKLIRGIPPYNLRVVPTLYACQNGQLLNMCDRILNDVDLQEFFNESLKFTSTNTLTRV